MRQKSGPVKEPATQVLKNIRRATRRHFWAEDKIRIVLEGLRGEDSIAELCRREGIARRALQLVQDGLTHHAAGLAVRGRCGVRCHVVFLSSWVWTSSWEWA